MAPWSPEWFLFVFPWSQLNINILNVARWYTAQLKVSGQVSVSLSAVFSDAKLHCYQLCVHVMFDELRTANAYIQMSLAWLGGGIPSRSDGAVAGDCPNTVPAAGAPIPFYTKTSAGKPSNIHDREIQLLIHFGQRIRGCCRNHSGPKNACWKE